MSEEGISRRIYEPVSLGCMILGTVERIPQKWVARGPDWEVIGIHATWREAVDAIWVEHIANPQRGPKRRLRRSVGSKNRGCARWQHGLVKGDELEALRLQHVQAPATGPPLKRTGWLERASPRRASAAWSAGNRSRTGSAGSRVRKMNWLLRTVADVKRCQ
jgi:hypothetical protein